MKVRRNNRVASVAVIVAVGVNSDGWRQVLGMDIGPSEAETFWTEFLRKLRRRGVKLVVSDAHKGVKAAVSKLMNATCQRCRVHNMRNALAHAGKSRRRVVSPFIATAFAQDRAETVRTDWRKIATLVGVASITRSSGSSTDAASTRGGEVRARHSVHERLRASSHNPTFKAFCDRLRADGKPHKVAVFAVIRKLVVTLKAIVKTRQDLKNALT